MSKFFINRPIVAMDDGLIVGLRRDNWRLRGGGAIRTKTIRSRCSLGWIVPVPILDGLQAASRLGSNHRSKIVFLSVHEDPEDFVDAAFAVGACGYVAKSDVTTDLAPAIREVLQGHMFVSKSIAP